MENGKVSIIVPVYNVEDYIDDCIESIVKQTFSDIEILLIVGQSTDNSTFKCEEWLKRDSRIRLIKEKEPGLGPARNQGVREASGEYIAFVDSDDMIRPAYVEKMYAAMIKEGADAAECDYSKIRSYTEKREYVPCTKILKKEFGIGEKLLLGSCTMWKIMTAKALWQTNEIMQPYGPGEDFFTYPFLLIYANKIVNVSEDLYLYRKDRQGNMCGSMEKVSAQFADMVGQFLEECKKRHLLDKYEELLSAYVRRWISRHSSPCLGKMDKGHYTEMMQKYVGIYKKYFPSHDLAGEMLLGGFNLSRIINKLPLIEDPYCRINFTSLISIMSERTKKYPISHKNNYRAFMLRREYENHFFELLEKQRPKYFFFDLLEERHNIIKVEGMYFTGSDAFEQAEINLGDSAAVIERNSGECRRIWESSCISFFEKLFEYVEPENIFMVKNFLMEQYGNGVEKRFFPDLEKIQMLNGILRNYYAFIEKQFPDIQIVEVSSEDEYYYTDINHEFGCYPWHLNEWENFKIAGDFIHKFL